MDDATPLHASLVLRRGLGGRVGAERVALLDAIDETGSLSAAAKRLGLSYKGAWDAAQALNNLFDGPLIETRAGGGGGGSASLTARGRAVATGLRTLQRELATTLARLETVVGEGGETQDLIWSLGMRTSARNALKGVVVEVTDGAVNAEVALEVAPGVRIVAVATRQSVAELDLRPGVAAVALIKSSFITLAVGEGLRTSARNQLAGVVSRREDGAVNSEVTLELAHGKTLTATITRQSAEALDLRPGAAAIALIKAPHVILAVE